MQRHLCLALTALIVFATSLTGTAQKFVARNIRFNGDPEYSDKEWMAVAQLKPGVAFTTAEMSGHVKLLVDSGVLDNVSYIFDGVDLIFTLTPSTQLFPIRLGNLPLAPGPELDAKLHDRLPLYHGKVPAGGALLENVRCALEQLLEAQGIKATVTALPFGAAGTSTVSAINFSIASPPVRVGALELHGISPAMAAKAKLAADHATGTPFDTQNSAANLEHAFASVYSEEGYAAVKVSAQRSGDPAVSADAVEIPFSVTVDEGRVYKLGAVHLPPDALVTQAEVDKATAAQGTTARGVSVRSIWGIIAQRYHAKGYMDFAMTPHPELDEATGTANYTVEIKPGPVYHLGLLKFDNVSDELRKLLMRNWQMFPGDPYNESYLAGFVATAQSSDSVLMRTLAGVKITYNAQTDPVSHDVNLTIRLERR